MQYTHHTTEHRRHHRKANGLAPTHQNVVEEYHQPLVQCFKRIYPRMRLRVHVTAIRQNLEHGSAEYEDGRHQHDEDEHANHKVGHMACFPTLCVELPQTMIISANHDGGTAVEYRDEQPRRHTRHHTPYNTDHQCVLLVRAPAGKGRHHCGKHSQKHHQQPQEGRVRQQLQTPVIPRVEQRYLAPEDNIPQGANDAPPAVVGVQNETQGLEEIDSSGEPRDFGGPSAFEQQQQRKNPSVDAIDSHSRILHVRIYRGYAPTPPSSAHFGSGHVDLRRMTEDKPSPPLRTGGTAQPQTAGIYPRCCLVSSTLNLQ
eukprot:Hpha_TRINITY_DN16140_c0_g7::TRINITY_DN16140_c0_g7_i2::g.8629::m.8629